MVGESAAGRTAVSTHSQEWICGSKRPSRAVYRRTSSIYGGRGVWTGKGTGKTDSRHEATPELWQETYLSALLRAIRYADDASYRLAGYRKLDPITTLEAEMRFLAVAEALFFKGWQLGSDPEIQVATVVNNHLTAGIMKYFTDSYRLDRAANLFEKVMMKEPEIAALLARSYIGMSAAIKKRVQA